MQTTRSHVASIFAFLAGVIFFGYVTKRLIGSKRKRTKEPSDPSEDVTSCEDDHQESETKDNLNLKDLKSTNETDESEDNSVVVLKDDENGDTENHDRIEAIRVPQSFNFLKDGKPKQDYSDTVSPDSGIFVNEKETEKINVATAVNQESVLIPNKESKIPKQVDRPKEINGKSEKQESLRKRSFDGANKISKDDKSKDLKIVEILDSPKKVELKKSQSDQFVLNKIKPSRFDKFRKTLASGKAKEEASAVKNGEVNTEKKENPDDEKLFKFGLHEDQKNCGDANSTKSKWSEQETKPLLSPPPSSNKGPRKRLIPEAIKKTDKTESSDKESQKEEGFVSEGVRNKDTNIGSPESQESAAEHFANFEDHFGSTKDLAAPLTEHTETVKEKLGSLTQTKKEKIPDCVLEREPLLGFDNDLDESQNESADTDVSFSLQVSNDTSTECSLDVTPQTRASYIKDLSENSYADSLEDITCAGDSLENIPSTVEDQSFPLRNNQTRLCHSPSPAKSDVSTSSRSSCSSDSLESVHVKEEPSPRESSPDECISQEEIQSTMAAVQKNPNNLEEKHVKMLVSLLKITDYDLLQKVLVTIANTSAFTHNQNLFREAGCLPKLARLLRAHSMALHLNQSIKYPVIISSLLTTITNLAVNEENQKQLKECIPNMIDFAISPSTPDSVLQSSLQALTNLSVQNSFHMPYTQLIQKLYEFLDTGKPAIQVQALKIMVNLSCNKEMVPHMLAARAPASMLDLLRLSNDEDIILRWITFLGNVMWTARDRGMTYATLPTEFKAPSPETMYTALYGMNNSVHLRSKVFILSKHKNQDIKYHATRIYSCLA